MLTATKSAVFV